MGRQRYSRIGPHLVWAVTLYAVVIVAGAAAMYSTGHEHSVGDFVAGAIFGPVIVGFFLSMFIDW